MCSVLTEKYSQLTKWRESSSLLIFWTALRPSTVVLCPMFNVSPKYQYFWEDANTAPGEMSAPTYFATLKRWIKRALSNRELFARDPGLRSAQKRVKRWKLLMVDSSSFLHICTLAISLCFTSSDSKDRLTHFSHTSLCSHWPTVSSLKKNWKTVSITKRWLHFRVFLSGHDTWTLFTWSDNRNASKSSVSASALP
jgi:hypothetical protein